MDECRPLVSSAKAPPYDRSKSLGEQVVRRAAVDGLSTVIIKPTAVIGPFDYRPSHFGQALLMMASGKLPALIKGGFDWVDARDVAEYAVKAAETAPDGSDYLFSGHWLSVGDLARAATSVTGKSCPSFMCPNSVAQLCAPVMTATLQLAGKRPIFTSVTLRALASNSKVSHAKATAQLGYTPRPFDDTIADTVNWFIENGYLKNGRTNAS